MERLGYVQIDSINVLDRAHHLILGTRLQGFRPAHLSHGLERSRLLFEHWTHDASAIPTAWYQHWKHRFQRYADRGSRSSWWTERFGGRPEVVLRRVEERVRAEGALRARDFEPPDDHRGGGWWEWHPEKSALEHLWRIGVLAIARRERFEKAYDLSERVHPEHHGGHASDEAAHDAWACREAMQRLGVATAKEVAAFFRAIPIDRARRWCAAGVARGELEAVSVTPLGGGRAVRAFAIPSWRRRVREPDRERMTALCPFDPIVRDRDRAQRLFGFDYRFEAFTPAAKRRYGYYVLPLLEGDSLVGRIDPRFDRERGVMVVRGPWWEPGYRMNPQRRRRLEGCLDRLAAIVGSPRWTLAGTAAASRAGPQRAAGVR